MKKVIAVFLSLVMLAGILPSGIPVFAEDRASRLELISYGHSGTASDAGFVVATGIYPNDDPTGTVNRAPYIDGTTASFKTNLSVTRIGVMAFSAEGVNADEIKKATLKVYVNSVNENVGNGWMRLAVYETGNPLLDYSAGDMDQSQFAAINNDYSYNAAMWSEEKFTYKGSEGVKAGWATVDVTEAVKNAVRSGKSYVVLRFQVPTGGIYLSCEGNYAPYIDLAMGSAAEITINCVDENGSVIKTYTKYGLIGERYTAIADKYITLNETVYTISGMQEQTITVNSESNEVTFSYTDVESSILAKYEFEDSRFEKGATLSDSSGNGYDAQVAGGDLGMTRGVFGGAINMNSNGYIELPEELLQALKGKTQYTISAFVKKNSLQNQFLFSASANHLKSNGKSIGIIDANNYRYEGNGDKVTTGQRTATDTDYVALTAVFDHKGRTLTLYTDGVKAGSGSLTESLNTVGAKVMGIGVSPWNDPYYNGYIDNFAIFEEALSADDVRKIAGKITVTPVYRDIDNDREYRGEPVTLRPNEKVSFEKSIKDTDTSYNYVAKYENELTTTVSYYDEGSYDYVIECTSGKNSAYAIADELSIGGNCSEDNITLPSKVEGYESSSITWACDSEQVIISGESVSFIKTDKAVNAVITALITNEGESCTKDFTVLIHANDATPKAGTRAVDINGIGYTALGGENLIDKNKFDYTCNTYIGWTSGGKALGSNFSIGEGYNDCGAIFSETLSESSKEGSINPYIPLPEHTGDETFIISFAAYSPSVTSIEWSNAYLCDESLVATDYVWGSYDGTNYKHGVKASSEWAVNRFAFTPSKDDKYIRIAIGWAQNIGIDNISIVKAGELTVEVSERYIDNETVYDDEPLVLGYGEGSTLLQYGDSYVSEQVPDSLIYDGQKYVLVSSREARPVSSENDGKAVIDYRYVKAEDAFVHPGVLNTEADLERIAKAVANGEEPYLSGYNALISNSYAQIGTPRAVGTITRGGSGENFALIYQDAARAYLCAIRWKISGDTAYADCARDILNAWSGTLKSVGGNADRYLTAIYSYQLAAASELLRDYPGFERERMQDMLYTVFYNRMTEQFLYSNEYGTDHNYAHIMNYWANWDLCNMAAAMAIGVFCDRRDIYDRAVEYYKFGAGNGSIFNAVPKVYEASEATMGVPVGQWQESGRDMEHTQMGIGLMAVTCEIAWNQGDDLYGWANNRFMYGAEYIAQYHLGQNVPFTEYNWYTGNPGTWSSQTVISGAAGIRPVFEMIYNHYKNRKGLEVPGMEALLETVRPEGGPGGHASSFDQPGFGTLLYTRDPGDATEAVLGESNVKAGIYRITSRLSGKALTEDADGYVKQYAVDENNENQLWKLDDLGGGIYRLVNMATGNTMSVEDDSYDLRAKMKTGSYEGKFTQQFAFLRFDDEGAERKFYDGYYRMVPVGSGLSVDVLQSSLEDGASVIQYTNNSGHHQQWELTRVDSDPEQQRPDYEITFADENTACFYAKESARAIIAIYDEAGMLISAETQSVTGEETILFTPPTSGKVKLMLWGGDLVPLVESEEKIY